MARIKRGVASHKKHKKILKLTKGHVGGRSTRIREAKQSAWHAGQYAFAGRRQRRRDFRKLWITQLNAAVKAEGLSYSKFINALKVKNINLDRKILAELAVKNPEDFKKIVSQINS
ncbi:50S ribosomal protein L20 [Candidatus Daviesbacteria bacterium]|nr:50S ribosomal protein L20 [Candidatus Daviesbacteria bacterium]